ncbi:MAG TPA: hypothetical protein VK970_10605, partial [Candidatus Methylacidiphilales bacterium]|nr:hypothetical protein [Candidatus Methylacidiphilales bacterium]
MNSRNAFIRRLAKRIAAAADAVHPAGRMLRVGIDGDAGSGKTTLGSELASALTSLGRSVIIASTDHFHHPSAIRYRQGKCSPDGFYEDSYDYATLCRILLDPLSSGGNGRYRPRAFDHRLDAPVIVEETSAPSGAILLFEGLFLHRPELHQYWDFSLFLDASVATCLGRCAARGDGSSDPLAESNRRYVEGFRRYVRECDPCAKATVVIDHEDLEHPHITRECS